MAGIIAKSPCTLIKGLPKKPPVNFDESKCQKCKKCSNDLACSAISFKDNKIVVDKSMCNGCNICVQVCKYGALTEGR